MGRVFGRCVGRRWSVLGLAAVLVWLPGCGSKSPHAAVSHPVPPATNTLAVPEAGPACAGFSIDPANPGSFHAMARKPVGTPISRSPGLSTVGGVVKTAGLGELLESPPGV